MKTRLTFQKQRCLSDWTAHHSHGLKIKQVSTCQGFTLMEMTLVMLIMGLMVGLAAYSFGGVSGEEVLRRPAADFRKVVLEAVRRSSLYEQTQVIRFDAQGLSLRKRVTANHHPHPFPHHQMATSSQDWGWQRKCIWPTGMMVKLRRFGQTQFAPAAGQMLMIAPGGLCEPLTARFESEGSWLEITLDPLSGGVAEEAMHLEGGEGR